MGWSPKFVQGKIRREILRDVRRVIRLKNVGMRVSASKNNFLPYTNIWNELMFTLRKALDSFAFLHHFRYMQDTLGKG